MMEKPTRRGDIMTDERLNGLRDFVEIDSLYEELIDEIDRLRSIVNGTVLVTWGQCEIGAKDSSEMSWKCKEFESIEGFKEYSKESTKRGNQHFLLNVERI